MPEWKSINLLVNRRGFGPRAVLICGEVLHVTPLDEPPIRSPEVDHLLLVGGQEDGLKFFRAPQIFNSHDHSIANFQFQVRRPRNAKPTFVDLFAVNKHDCRIIYGDVKAARQAVRHLVREQPFGRE